MKNTITIPFSSQFGDDYTLRLVFGEYQNGQHAIRLIDEADGAPYAVATVAVDYPIAKDEVAIKNWSENEGILEALIENNIVSKPIGQFSIGFVQVPICKLLV